jgi:nucleotidyltransferase substrate binding protein (TIGR01987 family)
MKKYENYCSNLRILEQAHKENLENEFIISGIIDKFSIQFELGWKLLKVLLTYEGRPAAVTGSPRSIIKEAYAVYPFFDGELWLRMLKERNDMSHIYDGNEAKELVNRIIKEYIPQFAALETSLVQQYGDMLSLKHGEKL